MHFLSVVSLSMSIILSLPSYSINNDYNNVCCHFCRLNKHNRRTINYIDCRFCRQTFCQKCIKKNRHLQMIYDGTGCPVCAYSCCCSFEICRREHRHCHTYRRTSRPHKKKRRHLKKKKLDHIDLSWPMNDDLADISGSCSCCSSLLHFNLDEEISRSLIELQ
jgi:hypothetical protein